jgi:hypothetical protein
MILVITIFMSDIKENNKINYILMIDKIKKYKKKKEKFLKIN